MRILIVGARGQLATSLQRVLPAEELTALGREQLDISDAPRVRETVRALLPAVIINTAAVRRPDVCEDDPERTFAVNAFGPRNLALACADVDAALVQVSTDNVFDGSKTSPYLEEDPTNPITVYGMSKLAGEFFVRTLLQKYYIVRTAGLFGEGRALGPATNFVLTMLRQARESQETRVVTDQFISPTYTIDLAEKIAWLITTEAYGLYHIANAGGCSWYEFTRAIFKKAGVTANLLPTTTEALNLRARRLRNAVLSNGALRRLASDDLRPWEDALDRYLRTLGSGDIVQA